MFHEDNLLNKEFDASLRIINPPPILDQIELGNTNVKNKSFITSNAIVELTKRDNKTLVTSINKIHIINLEIEKQCSQALKNSKISKFNIFKRMLKSTIHRKAWSNISLH